MKIIQNKKLFKRILFVLLCIIIISFCIPQRTSAKSIGGKLLEPVIELNLSIGDALLDIVHLVINHQERTLIPIDTSGILAKIKMIVAVVLAMILATTLIVFAPGAIAAAAGVALSSVSLGTVLLVTTVSGAVAGIHVYNKDILPKLIKFPVYTVSPEEIFSNDILLFDVDFFNPKESKVAEDGTVLESTAETLRSTISSVYTILRDIAVVALLSVLVYIGIRIVISSTSNDKAKYKQLLMDWLVAMCLLFIMQYIMSFSNLAVGKITDLLKSVKYDAGQGALIEDENGAFAEKLKKEGYTVDTTSAEGYITWPTNLIGIARLSAQTSREDSSTYAGYAIAFIALVLFTIFFIFTYIKRVLYMAFLTIIAPLVALTYPIDKMNDGKAQAFDMWFKEYIFNLLIQPLHLLLYTVLVSSAFELASNNILYSIVAIWFMIPAEKMLRKFFGFEKAHTPGLLAGPAGAAATMGMVNKLFGKAPKGPKSAKGVSGKGDVDSAEKAPRFSSNFDTIGGMVGDGSGYKTQGENKPALDTQEQQADKNTNKQPYGGYNNEPYMSDELDGMGVASSAMNAIEKEDYKNNSSYYMGDVLENQNTKDNTNPVDGNSSNKAETPVRTKNPNKDSMDKKQRMARKLRVAKAGGKQAMKYYGKGLVRNVGRGITNAHLGRKIRNASVGIAGAAAVAPAAIALGMATGDSSKAVQIIGGISAGSYKIASSIPNMVDSLTPQDVQQRVDDKLSNDEEYQAIQKERYIKQFKKNEQNRARLEGKYGRKEAKSIMNDVVPEYLDAGINNIDDIMIGYEMEKNGIKSVDGKETEYLSRNSAISTVKYAGRIGQDTTKMKKKDRSDWHDTLAAELGKNEKIKANNIDVNDAASKSLNRIDAYNKLKAKK